MTPRNVHTSAIVLVPPAGTWEPIQAIRRRRDRQFRRWMPHVTLLYPFRPREALAGAVPALERACAGIAPFEVSLERPAFFDHGRGGFTVWLAPEPRDALAGLYRALVREFPDCDAAARHGRPFTPHLSLGQARGERELRAFVDEVAAAWRPVAFTLRHIAAIVRGAPPDDVFRVEREVPLGG